MLAGGALVLEGLYAVAHTSLALDINEKASEFPIVLAGFADGLFAIGLLVLITILYQIYSGIVCKFDLELADSCYSPVFTLGMAVFFSASFLDSIRPLRFFVVGIALLAISGRVFYAKKRAAGTPFEIQFYLWLIWLCIYLGAMLLLSFAYAGLWYMEDLTPQHKTLAALLMHILFLAESMRVYFLVRRYITSERYGRSVALFCGVD